MSRGAGSHGSLSNVDVSSDRNIDHLNIDKSARLHTQVLAAVLEVVGNGGGNERLAPTANDRNAQRSIPTPEAGKSGAIKPANRRGRQPNPAIASPIRFNPYCRIECRVSDLALGRRLRTHALIEYPGQASLTPAAQVARSQWAVATIAQTPTSAALVKSKKTIAALEPLLRQAHPSSSAASVSLRGRCAPGWKQSTVGKDMPSNWRSPPRPGAGRGSPDRSTVRGCSARVAGIADQIETIRIFPNDVGCRAMAQFH